MSSFKRKTASASQRLSGGVKSSPALPTVLLCSSGIPSLDDALGGGIQLGTSLLVLNPDPHSSHTDLLQKYFIAQGLASDQTVHVFDSDAKSLVNTCMWMPGAAATSVPVDGDDVPDADEGKVKIAWRYEHMQKFKTTVSSKGPDQEDYCRPFDLTCRIPTDTIQMFLSAGHLWLECSCFEGSQDVYESVIQRIEDIVKTSEDPNAANKQKVIRLSIPVLSCPAWDDARPEKILRFLMRLRALMRRIPFICAFVTLPAHVCSDSWAGQGWIERLSWISDACIELNSSAADPASAALFPSHHGLLRIHRLPCVQTLVPASDRFSTLRGLSAPTSSTSSSGIGENNLAFKCTRKRFVIETFHLDIDGGVGERRTTPAASSVAIQEGVSEEMASQHQSHHDSENQSRVAIEMEDQTPGMGNTMSKPSDEQMSAAHGKKEVKKKPKKRVGFQVDRPDIFDF